MLTLKLARIAHPYRLTAFFLNDRPITAIAYDTLRHRAVIKGRLCNITSKKEAIPGGEVVRHECTAIFGEDNDAGRIAKGSKEAGPVSIGHGRDVGDRCSIGSPHGNGPGAQNGTGYRAPYGALDNRLP